MYKIIIKTMKTMLMILLAFCLFAKIASSKYTFTHHELHSKAEMPKIASLDNGNVFVITSDPNKNISPLIIISNNKIKNEYILIPKEDEEEPEEEETPKPDEDEERKEKNKKTYDNFNKGFLFEGETFYPRVNDKINMNNNDVKINYSPEERIERNFKNIKKKWTNIQKNE